MLFSIITINYNNGKHLAETFESVLIQSYADFEYLVLDGGSTDGSVDIIKKYEPLFNGKMKWLSEPDRGISDAFNKGIRKASGEIIGIINSGDYYSPDALEIVADEYSKKKFDLFYGDTKKVYDNGEIYSYVNAKKWIKIFNGLTFMHSACFVPKIVYDTIGLFDEKYKIAMDIDLLLRIYKFSKNIRYNNRLISHQRIGGISHQYAVKGMKEARLISITLFPKSNIKIWIAYFQRLIKYLFVQILKKLGVRLILKNLVQK